MFSKTNNFPKCWICLNTGLVMKVKRQNGIDYDIAERCTCKEGQKMSNTIRTVSHELAKEKAMENYMTYKKHISKKFISQCANESVPISCLSL